MAGRFRFMLLPSLFAVTLFLSAALLFLSELMIAKLILPLFGGTPAVWNTCMMFFQALLLAGYAYAHLSGTGRTLRRQIILHLALLGAAGLFLPIALPGKGEPIPGGSPIGSILLLLSLSIGLPFLVLSATAPLLQRWFTRTGHPSAGDPYFLYSASNLGSMLALIGYPTLIEPKIRLAAQCRAWTIGYLTVLLLTVVCAALANRGRSLCPKEGQVKTTVPNDPRPSAMATLGWGDRGRWVLRSFVPSSLMLGVTAFLSTDIAAIPLFWILPLSLYLLSFIMVFARTPALIHKLMMLLAPFSLSASLLATYADLHIPKWTVLLFHLITFFLFCMVCHGELARSRPAAARLTEFYLWMSAGGVLGGIFNSLIAPVVFPTVMEYLLALILGALLIPVSGRARGDGAMGWKNWLLPVGIPALLVPLTYFSMTGGYLASLKLLSLQEFLPLSLKSFDALILYGCPLLLCLAILLLRRPYLFGLGIAAILLTMVTAKDLRQDIIHRERSFFGVLTVTRDPDGVFMNLSHGTTLHGKQWLEPLRRQEPVSYYHREGPVGQVFSSLETLGKIRRIAVTGLGTGSIAAYAGPDQSLDYYEIDPAVKRIATDPAFFTFLSECLAPWQIILGDARLTLAQAPPGHYDLIILDAFSSDAIPVHLLTREAVRLYFSRLTGDGALLMHITNRYVNLAPVLATLAAEEGYAARLCDDEGDFKTGKDGSTWVLMARRESDLGDLYREGNWVDLGPPGKVSAWSDDFSNLLSVFKW